MEVSPYFSLLLCVTTALHVAGSSAQWLTAENVTATEGTAATLRCSFNVNATNNSFDLSMVKSTGSISSFIIASDSTTVNLTISSTTMADAGEYICTAESDNAILSTSVFLQVQGAPSLTVTAEDVTASVGESANLQCTVVTNLNRPHLNISISNTRSSVDISLTRRQMANGSTVAVAVISNVQLSDAGEYRCTATQEGLHAQDTFRLTVTKGLLVSVVPVSQSVSLGVDATFFCNTSAGMNVELSWLKNNRPFQNPEPPANTLVLKNVSYFDMATYTCVAENGIQEAMASADLRVNGYRAPFVIGNPGIFTAVDSMDTVVVECDIMGNPKPIYIWVNSSSDFVEVFTSRPPEGYTGLYVAANGSLMLALATPSDTGVYVCYGIDPVTRLNISSPYHITIRIVDVVWTRWYLILVYVVVVLFLVFMVALFCYFFVTFYDICPGSHKREMMTMDDAQESTSWPWLNPMETGAANPAYEINFKNENIVDQNVGNDELMVNEKIDGSKKKRKVEINPEPTIMTAPHGNHVPAEVTEEQHEVREERSFIQEGDKKPKVKKTKKEKHLVNKKKDTSNTSLFLY